MGGKITGGKEFELWFGKSVAEQIQAEMMAAGVPKVVIAGSIRRRKKMVHDVDIVAFGDAEDPVDPLFMYCMTKWGPAKTKKRDRITGLMKICPKRSGVVRGINVEVYPALEHNWVANVQTWTGSVEFNIKMRRYALKEGLSLSQKTGLIPNGKPDSPILLENEEQLFKVLGMSYVEPEKREV